MTRVHLRFLIGMLAAAAIASVYPFTESRATGTIGKADLAGSWQVSLTGDTGCGVSTISLVISMNTTGTGTVVNESHTSGCGNPTSNTETFTILTLNPNGSGTAGLTCGAGCGFTFRIQVAPDRSMFNLVDVTDPGNYLEGIAIHQ